MLNILINGLKIKKSISNQSGAALLALMLVIVVGSAYTLVLKLNTNVRYQYRQSVTVNALAEAKRALIAYAVTHYDDNPGEYGFLPCPDVDESSFTTEGIEHGNCGAQHVNSIGRLPWKTLGLAPLKDSDGECLWYAVSGQFKANPEADMLNADSYGTFEVYASDGTTRLAGNSAMDRAVAVIIAPGTALPGQDRALLIEDASVSPDVAICGGNYDANDYLDAEVPADPVTGIENYSLSANADTLDQFIDASTITGDENPDFNDVIFYITAEEIFDAVRKRNDFQTKMNELTRRAALCLVEYGSATCTSNDPNSGNCSLPWPAPLELADYRDSSLYNDMSASDNLLSGRLPNIADDSEATINGTRVTNLITDCSQFPAAGEYALLWENWKDHLFYAVSDPYQPVISATTGLCSNGRRCITLNGNYSASSNDLAAIVYFANSISGAQTRLMPPFDTDERLTISNYLEGTNNQTAYLNTAWDDTKRYDTSVSGSNDIVYCVNDPDSNPSGLSGHFDVEDCTNY